METNSKELCRLCLEASADRVNVFDNFGDSTIATILSKHFWFKVSKNDFSECVCGVCWTNVKSFHNFYKRVEWLHGKHSAATEETNSSSAVFHPDQRNCVLSEPDLNIVKCEETGTRFEVIDLHIKNEEYSDNDNDNNADISLDEIEDASNSSDDYDRSSNKSQTIHDAGVKDKSSRIECNGNMALKESHQFYTQENGEDGEKAKEEASIRELFDLKCKICSDDIEFQTFKEFKNHHREIHQTIGNLKCCGATLSKRNEVLKHIRQHSAERLIDDAAIRQLFDLKCNNCIDNVRFETFKEFRKHHREIHKTIGNLKCCGTTLKKRSEVLKHIRQHNAKRLTEDAQIREFFNMKCSSCSGDVRFETFKEFRKHHREIHQTNGNLKCCDATLGRRKELLVHIRQHSADRAMEDHRIREFYDFKCGICGDDNFQTFTEFKKHHSNVHKTRGSLKCCAKRINKRCHLLQHMQYHLNPDAYRCDRCGKQFGQASSLKSHMATHTLVSGRTYSCYQCGKSFKVVATLKQHMEYKHTSQKDGESFPCNKCNKVFPTKLSWKCHTRYVHKPSTFICDICARVFKSKSILLNHMEQHSTTTRPKEQCNVCGVWLNSVYLRRHVKEQHNKNNDVTVNCPTCNKVIRNKRLLAQHIRSVHCELKHKCTLCDKAFKSPKNLKEHVAAIHTGEDLYDCSYCPKKFKSNANLYSHRKKIHFGEWSQESRNGVPK